MITKHLLLVALCITISYGLGAQENIRFERITPSEGLSQSDVKCMIQDKLGFLWIGTRDGLNKYDGLTFTRFTHVKGDTNTLYFNQIFDLETDSKGDIWIASRGGIGRYQYQTGNFINYFFKASELSYDGEINDISITNDSSIICSTNNGIFTFDIATESFSSKPAYAQFANSQVFELKKSPNFGELIGTNQGLYIQAPKSNSWIKLLEGTVINHLNVEKDHVLVSTNKGLFKCYQDYTLKRIDVPGGFTNINEAIRTNNGDLWLACDRIVVLAKDDKTEKYIFSHEQGNILSLSENRTRTLFQTDDGTVWIGTNGYGLNKFNPDVLLFPYLSEYTRIKLSNNYVSSVYTSDDNLLLIGTTRGLNLVDLKSGKVNQHFAGDDMFLVFKIKSDKKGGVWVSSSSGFFQYLNGKLLLRNSDFRAIPDFIDLDNRMLLLATRFQGLFTFDKINFKTNQLISPDLLPEEVFTTLIYRNLIWVGSKDGLRVFTLDGKLQKHHKNNWGDPNSLHSSYIKGLFVDHLDRLWVGTWGGGLSLFNHMENTFTTFDVNNGLPNNVVYGILEDELGTLWLSTNFGLAAFDPRTNVFKTFDFSDGLQGNEFNTGAFFKSIYGKMYFGGTNGLSFFNPDFTLTTESKNRVLITGITINNEKVSENNEPRYEQLIESDWLKNNIAIEFTVVDFKRTTKNYFQYSINDSDWFIIGNTRSIDLINLRPGEHHVKIRTRNPESGWSPQYAQVTIKIAAPFWRTPWGIGGGLATLLLMGFILFRLRLRRINKLNSELQRLVAEKTQEIILKNNEILAQNEELVSQTEQLGGQNVLLEEQKEKLQEFSSDLEEKINDRVNQIQSLNQDLAEQNMELQQLYFIISNNFNSPLKKIKKFLLSMNVGGNQMTLPKEIIDGIAELEQAMLELGTVSKIQNSSRDIFETISLDVILNKVLGMLGEEIKLTGIKIVTTSFEKLEIKGIRTLIQSIFYLLIKNATSNTENLSPVLRISCSQDGGKVKVTFIDNKPEKRLKHTLDKVFRFDKRFSIGNGGFSLDLYFVKRQIDAMGGQISIETSLTGSTFILEFPSPK